MKKKIILYFLAALMVIMPLNLVAATNPNIKVTLNGKPLTTKVTELSDKSRYLPIKDLLTPLGYTITFNAKENTLVAEKGASKLRFPVGQKYVIKNGKKITLPRAIQTYNNTVCISSDSLKPSLNATCMYFSNTQTLEVQIFTNFIDTELKDIPQLSMPKESLAAYKKVMNTKINFMIDERLFTFMAYIHYLGYNMDNGGTYSPTRKNLLADLKAKELHLTAKEPEIREYFKSFTAASLVRNLGSAPTFTPIPGGEYYDATFYNELSTALQEFYAHADIHTLFLKYKKDYEAAINDYKASDLMDGICNILYFLKIKPEDAPAMTILINLTDVNLNGLGLTYDPGLGVPTIIMGPAVASAGKVTIIHEYLHGIMGPILKKYASEVEALNQLSSVSDSSLIKNHYNDWHAVVEESLVRALDFLPFAFPRHYQIGQQKQQGFILIDYFYNSFASYPASSSDLDAYIYQLLINYKVAN